MCRIMEDMRREAAEEAAREAAKEAAKEAAREAELKSARETAERMIRMGKLSLEEIALYIPLLSLDELKELESEVMQLA